METIDKKKNALLRKFHAMLRQRGIDNYEKQAMLAAYGVEHSNEMSTEDLASLLERMGSPANEEQDRWRKRVMAAIGAYLRTTGRTESADMIKAIACRAAGSANFNSISKGRLRDIYAEFCRKQQVHEAMNLLSYMLNKN